MLLPDLSSLYNRDLHTLRKEIEAFKQEADLWRTLPGIANSAGNLCLHLCGNLRHFIGHGLGGEAYVRDRPKEFSAKDLPQAELLAEIDRTLASVKQGLSAKEAGHLEAPFPITVPVEVANTGHFLVYLHGHLNYHLGQVNYLRRILEA